MKIPFSRSLAHSVVFLAPVLCCFPACPQHAVLHDDVLFEWAQAGNGILIAAPHAAWDRNTDKIAIGVARLLGSGYLVTTAKGDSIRRTNVNRPTEKNLFGSGEIRTHRSEAVYLKYLDLVQHSSGLPLRAYIEIHGHSNHRLGHVVEVATLGLTLQEAQRMKDAFKAACEGEVGSLPRNLRLEVKVEPIDRLHYQANASKRIGVLSQNVSKVSLHIELPVAARRSNTEASVKRIIAAMVRAIVGH